MSHEDDRQLVYAFVSLNYIVAEQIAKQFITLTDEECGMVRPKLTLLILTRVQDEGKLEEFRTAVLARKAQDDAE